MTGILNYFKILSTKHMSKYNYHNIENAKCMGLLKLYINVYIIH